MKKSEWTAGLDHLDPALVEEYVKQRDALEKDAKRSAVVRLRFGAIAACFLLILSAVIAVPMLREDDPGIVPPITSEDSWSPVIGDGVSEVILTADEVGKLFHAASTDAAGTTQYTQVCAIFPSDLSLNPLPIAEYLPLYTSQNLPATESALQGFINEYADAAASLFGINATDYTIVPSETWNGKTYYQAELKDSGGEKGVYFIIKDNVLYFTNYSVSEKRIEINGNRVSVLASDTDAQIKEKLAPTISYVCNLLGKDFSNVRIRRDYYKQLRSLTVYLYSDEDESFPPDFTKPPMSSEYIALTFYTNQSYGGAGTTPYDWSGPVEEAFLTEVSLYQSWDTFYTVDAKARMLTLQEAEALLENGYVFGGHSCPLCMAEQAEVDFSDYTYVTVEYVFDTFGERALPFYAFYKYIGTNEYGVGVYARAYVAAVQISGYTEYFESQEKYHGKSYY